MNQKTILIADDEPYLLIILEKTLTDEGYTVVTAKNGEEALYLAINLCPDLIILDVSMPDMQGGEVAGHLRDNPETADIPVMFLTALLSKEQEEKEGNIIGGHTFMAKPYELEDLLSTVNNLLSQQEAQSR